MQQADDFLEEAHDLHRLIGDMDAGELATQTQFNQWSFDDVIGHLYMFDHAAVLTITDFAKYEAFFKPVATALNNGIPLLNLQIEWLDGLGSEALVAKWQESFTRLAALYRQIDPKTRIKWAGPDMSARSAITARQMETWAHGQAIYDRLGLERIDQDRIKNIVHMGVSTCNWTFSIRGETLPDPQPHVALASPSGQQWEWNTPQDDNHIKGNATEFCQIVTQTRNVADTSIIAKGKIANYWMSNAQCFAGPPHEPPKPGSRFIMTA